MVFSLRFEGSHAELRPAPVSAPARPSTTAQRQAEDVFTHDARHQLVRATGRVHNAFTRPEFRGDTPVSGTFRGHVASA